MKQTAWSKQPVVLLTKSLLFPVGPLWGRLNKRSLPGADQLRGTGSRGIRAALCEGVALILARRANLSNTRHTNHKQAPLRGLGLPMGAGLISALTLAVFVVFARGLGIGCGARDRNPHDFASHVVDPPHGLIHTAIGNIHHHFRSAGIVVVADTSNSQENLPVTVDACRATVGGNLHGKKIRRD